MIYFVECGLKRMLERNVNALFVCIHAGQILLPLGGISVKWEERMVQ